MDTERWKVNAETAAIRGRGWLRLCVRLAGLALVVAGGLNLLVGVDGGVLPVLLYRGLWVHHVGVAAWPVADAVAIGVGAAVANFV
jgi:hypothetical protein